MATATQQERPRAFYPGGTEYRPRRATPGWDQGPERRLDDGRAAARALGWCSIGLGAFQVVAPRVLTDFLGLDDRRTGVVRLFGVREIAHGAAILAERTPTAGVWSRVGGDVLDLAALGLVLRESRGERVRVSLAMAAVAGATVLDVFTAKKLHGRAIEAREGGVS